MCFGTDQMRVSSGSIFRQLSIVAPGVLQRAPMMAKRVLGFDLGIQHYVFIMSACLMITATHLNRSLGINIFSTKAERRVCKDYFI